MRGRRISSPSSQWRTSPIWTGSWQMLEEAENDFQVVTVGGANYQKNMLADFAPKCLPPS
ncbi:hypothetical protein FQN60_010590 [Etheostoma spectabile]|uniref:Uncharacterized protein n=1 Tax=Etheostoma spectabile TaxID=54343 RepID=A0A5J5CE70_9PERO|nr:hypothetical protein FQN60_010590 [Etheostoma spectabile]